MSRIVYALVLLAGVLAVTNCKKSEDPVPADAAFHEYTVLPQETDASIQTSTEPHYVYVDTRTALKGKLLVFLGGTDSYPRYYLFFSKAAAALGYHVINLSYLNDISVQVCKDQTDTECFTKYREESIFGGNQSPLVDISASNSIINRIVKLLVYLHSKYPSQGWNQFYSGANPLYSKYVVAGHSQGGGHAAYLALKYSVDRVIMFSSPNDYSDKYAQTASWCKGTFITPVDRFYGLMHKRDEVISPAKQYAIWKDMKMLVAADTSSADRPTYKNFKALVTNYESAPGSGLFGLRHNVPVIDKALPAGAQGDQLKEVWNYLLGN